MYFSFYNILPAVWVCLAVAVAATLYLITFYRLYIRIRPTVKPGADEVPDEELPPVSVIIYARDNAADLRRMLPEVLGQEYPEGKMEVSVVNDGGVEDVTDVVNYLGASHPNLRITFVPDDAHNLSRKKLAISLGVKAARNRVIVITAAECRPATRRWLRQMAAPFAPSGGSHSVVIGWAKVAGLKSAALRFDQVSRAVTWLSAAIHHKPYRGTGFNIAYTSDLFFEAKGFSRSLNLNYGDDDLFINQISNGDNTAVVLSPEATVSVHYQRPSHAYRDLRLQHVFTGRRLPKGSRIIMGSGQAAAWLWLAATVAGCVFSLPNWYPSCIFAALLPLLWVPLTLGWCRSARTLGVRIAPVLVWWQLLWRWTTDLRCMLACNRSHRKNFTWYVKKR